MNDKQIIVEILQDTSGKFPQTVIFDDWVKCLAISIQNSCKNVVDEIFLDRERQYKSIIEKYGNDITDIFAQMTIHLANALEKEIEDVLGIVYMEASMGNKGAGQFFTPTSISSLSARIVMNKIEKGELDTYTLYEPTSGSGGMILEIAKNLKEKGINYQKSIYVIAQDLDWRCVYMTYVQLSLLGISGIVIQGDSLEEPFEPGKEYPKHRLFFTPKRMGVL